AMQAAPQHRQIVRVGVKIYLTLEQLKDAKKVVATGLRSHSEDPYLLEARTWTEATANEWTTAHTTLRATIEKHPNDPELHAQLGDTHYQLGQHDEAKQAYQTTVSKEAHNARALTGLLQLAVDADDRDTAAAILEPIDAAELNNHAIDRARAR